MGSSGAKRQAEAQEEAARIQAETAITVGNNQASAAAEAAEISSAATLQAASTIASGNAYAASIGAGAAMHAANTAAAASNYAVDRLDERTQEAVERQEIAGGLARTDLLEGEEASLAVQNEQFDRASGLLDPYSTLEGFAGQLSEIQNSDIFGELVAERQESASSALGAAGLTRSGAAAREAARIDLGSALDINGIVYGNALNSVNIGQQYADNVTNIEQGTAANLANTRTATAAGQAANLVNSGVAGGQIINQGGLAQAQIIGQGGLAQAQIAANNANQQAGFIQQGGQIQSNAITQGAYYQGAAQTGAANATAQGLIGSGNAYAQGQQQQYAAIASAAATAAAIFFSDERLKENMTPIAKVGDLTLYQWDWKEGVKNRAGTEMSTGFSAQEAELKHPNCVIDIGGVKAIDYEKLKHELRLAA